MHTISTLTSDQPEEPGAVPSGRLPASRSFRRAFDDLRAGVAARELWSHLGWQDIKQRYRRSVLGPLWITISMAVTAFALGLLYSQLFQADIATFLPYITVGLITWHFLIGCLQEGSNAFIENEDMIKHLPAPLTVYALRTVWRLMIMFVHNLIVYAVILAIFFPALAQPGYTIIEEGGIPQPGLNVTALMAFPAFGALALNGLWVVLLLGITSTRFRDVPQVIAAISSLLFFMTPIVWSIDILAAKFPETGGGWRQYLYEFNPVYHFLEIIRAPMIGNVQSLHHWFVVGGFTVVGWLLTIVVMRNYRSRVSYWV
ncbi:ABC transporter permease [Haloechinothrix aidingensis]|uniref:galactan export ABC transporter permease subunit Wzm/RfbD n=1 Tax=Haloechinothrix aidingensis TaxID=2752311 RepID=UPI003CCD3DB3